MGSTLLLYVTGPRSGPLKLISGQDHNLLKMGTVSEDRVNASRVSPGKELMK